MDTLASCSGAASLLGLTSSHAFVYLARVVQETCAKLQHCTDNEVIISVTLSRVDGPGSLLLYASGYAGLAEEVEVSPQIENQISFGVESLASALQQLALEQQEKPRPTAPPVEMAAASPADMGADPDGAVADGERGADPDPLNQLINVGDGDAADPREGQDGASAAPLPENGPKLSEGASGAPAPIPAAGSDAPTAGSNAEGDPNDGAAADVQENAKVGLRSTGPASQMSAMRNDREASPAADGEFVMPSSFKIPGLVVPPQRILLPTGRGAARREPPLRPPRTVKISNELVNETMTELCRPGRDVSLRDRLKDFTALYKFVIDTLVKRALPDEGARKRVNHTYAQLTPEAVRNVSVEYRTQGGTLIMLTTPMFNNSHNMKATDALSVILLMKHERDPFFLWLLAQFCGGAKAPMEVVTRARPSPSPTKKGVKRKRARGGVAAAAQTAPALGAQPSTNGGGQAGPEESVEAAQRREAAAVSESTTPVQDQTIPGSVAGASGGDDGEEAAAARPPRVLASDGDGGAYQQLCARQLLSGDRVIATADVHPEFSSFHSGPVPPSVVSCFLVHVEAGCSEVVYPYGQDAALCLEKGNPSMTPVTLGSIQPSYKIAWPVASIGCVPWSLVLV